VLVALKVLLLMLMVPVAVVLTPYIAWFTVWLVVIVLFVTVKLLPLGKKIP